MGAYKLQHFMTRDYFWVRYELFTVFSRETIRTFGGDKSLLIPQLVVVSIIYDSCNNDKSWIIFLRQSKGTYLIKDSYLIMVW